MDGEKCVSPRSPKIWFRKTRTVRRKELLLLLSPGGEGKRVIVQWQSLFKGRPMEDLEFQNDPAHAFVRRR